MQVWIIGGYVETLEFKLIDVTLVSILQESPTLTFSHAGYYFTEYDIQRNHAHGKYNLYPIRCDLHQHFT